MKGTGAWRQGLCVFLLALGMVLGSGVLLYQIWRKPEIAVVIGAAVLGAGLSCWAGSRLMLRLAPGYILRKRLLKVCGRDGALILSRYSGSGSLLEDWDRASEADAETLADVSYMPVRLERCGPGALECSGQWAHARGLELKADACVLLIVSDWFHPIHLMGKITALRHTEDRCELEITPLRALFAERRREFAVPPTPPPAPPASPAGRATGTGGQRDGSGQAL